MFAVSDTSLYDLEKLSNSVFAFFRDSENITFFGKKLFRKRTFFTFTFLGSLVWSYFLVFVGVKMGQNMEMFKHLWHKFDILIIVICLILGFIYVYKHFKHLKES